MDYTGMGNRIREQRERKGWTPEQLAEKVGIAAGLLSDIEQGQYEPDMPTVTKLAVALGVSLDYLVDPLDVMGAAHMQFGEVTPERLTAAQELLRTALWLADSEWMFTNRE